MKQKLGVKQKIVNWLKRFSTEHTYFHLIFVCKLSQKCSFCNCVFQKNFFEFLKIRVVSRMVSVICDKISALQWSLLLALWKNQNNILRFTNQNKSFWTVLGQKMFFLQIYIFLEIFGNSHLVSAAKVVCFSWKNNPCVAC